MQTCDLISVLIPAYMATETIERAISSIQLSQAPHEIIITPDDGSTWYSEQYGKSPNIRVLEPTKRVGVANGLNRAFEVAEGTWITTIDADDYVSPMYLDRMLEQAKNAEVRCAFSSMAYVSHKTKAPTCIRQSKQSGQMSMEEFGDFYGSLKVLQHRDLWQDYVPSVAEDIPNIANLLLKCHDIPVAQAIYFCVIHDSSVCATTTQASFNEFYSQESNNYDGSAAQELFNKRISMGVKYMDYLNRASSNDYPAFGYHDFVALNVKDAT